jgi:hypothetical protein
MSDASVKPTHATTPGLDRYRPWIILFAYILSTSIYFLALHVASTSQLGNSLLCMLGFLAPDVMVIKLLGSPQPGMERLLLNYVGPFSTACTLKFYIFLS